MAIATATGLSACGKFEVAPNTKGVSTNSDPLSALQDDRLRDLLTNNETSSSQDPLATTPEDTSQPKSDSESISKKDKASRLKEVQSLFDETLADTSESLSEAHTATLTSTVQPAPAKVLSAAELSKLPQALIGGDISDDVKGQLILKLVEPTMRINFQIGLQRAELLKMKAVVDAGKSVSRDQLSLLESFRKSFGVAGVLDKQSITSQKASIYSLLTQVDTIAFSALLAPLVYSTNWGTLTPVTPEMISGRAQDLNVTSAEAPLRFRAERIRIGSSKLDNKGYRLLMAEIGYSTETSGQLGVEDQRLTQMEMSRIINLSNFKESFLHQVEIVRQQLIKESQPATSGDREAPAP